MHLTAFNFLPNLRQLFQTVHSGEQPKEKGSQKKKKKITSEKKRIGRNVGKLFYNCANWKYWTVVSFKFISSWHPACISHFVRKHKKCEIKSTQLTIQYILLFCVRFLAVKLRNFVNQRVFSFFFSFFNRRSDDCTNTNGVVTSVNMTETREIYEQMSLMDGLTMSLCRYFTLTKRDTLTQEKEKKMKISNKY